MPPASSSSRLTHPAGEPTSINAIIRDRMQRLEGWLLGLKIAFILVGGGAATVANFMPATQPNAIPVREIVGVAGGLVALIGGVAVAFIERGAPEALERAREATAAAQGFSVQREQFASELRGLRAEAGRQRQLYATAMTLRESIESAVITGRRMDEGAIQALLDVASRTLLAACDFGSGERWTLSVFRYDVASGLLKRIAGCRADRSEEHKTAREWGPGQGYAGAAFLQNREIVLADAQTQEMLALLHLPDDLHRGYDSQRYRSIAAIPIRPGAGDPWGVFMATSDLRGRFGPVSSESGWTSVEAARLVAGMVAVGVAVRDGHVDAAGTGG